MYQQVADLFKQQAIAFILRFQIDCAEIFSVGLKQLKIILRVGFIHIDLCRRLLALARNLSTALIIKRDHPDGHNAVALWPCWRNPGGLDQANLIGAGDEFDPIEPVEYFASNLEGKAVVVPEISKRQVHATRRKIQQAF